MYGSAEGVAALSKMWTDDGSYTTASKPSLADVEKWLGEISATLDTHLANEGFKTPITVPEVTPELDILVNGIVKDLVDYSRASGRFFTERRLDSGMSPYMIIDKELADWVTRRSIGLESRGVLKVSTNPGQHVATFDVL